MKPTLGGILVVRDGFKYDYCFREATQCLLELCDRVKVICFADSQHLEDLQALRPLEDYSSKLIVDAHDYHEWDYLYQGRERIAEWQNMAKRQLGTDWYFCLQADEIIHENSYAEIRRAIEYPNVDGFLNWRVNLWGDPQHMLKVSQDRLPCSEVVLRLAKLRFDSYGDGESIQVTHRPGELLKVSNAFIPHIRIYHMGFVRKREVMNPKIINMQEEVFQLGSHDKLCDEDAEKNGGIFDPYTRFSKDDLAPLIEPLPKLIQPWAAERMYL